MFTVEQHLLDLIVQDLFNTYMLIIAHLKFTAFPISQHHDDIIISATRRTQR